MSGEYESATDHTEGWSKPKLTPKQWDEVRRRYYEGETAPDLASEFGVPARTIWNKVGRR